MRADAAIKTARDYNMDLMKIQRAILVGQQQNLLRALGTTVTLEAGIIPKPMIPQAERVYMQ